MEDREITENTLKICICGSYGVGKSSIRRRIMDVSRFRRRYQPTVGSDFSFKELDYKDHKLKILIWDLAGEKQFRSTRSLYFQGADGALVVFDITSKESFKAIDEWIKDLHRYTENQGVPLQIIANKNDLILTEQEQAVTEEEVQNYISELREIYSDKFNIGYSKASALSGKNIKESFYELIDSILEWRGNLTRIKS